MTDDPKLFEMRFYGHLNEVKRIVKEGVDVNGKGLDGMNGTESCERKHQ